MPKGHTHGQIDQMFSNLSQYLKIHPAKTIPELRHSFFLSYNNPVKRKAKKQKKQEPDEAKRSSPAITELIETVVDVASWLAPLEIKTARRGFGLHKSHAFQLVTGPTNRDIILIRGKEWAMNEQWLVRCAFF
jgi:hypothetical protein